MKSSTGIQNPYDTSGGQLEWGTPAMGRALLRSGAATLSGKDFSQGIAKGASAFADAAQKARARQVAKQKAENKLTTQRTNQALQAQELQQEARQNQLERAKTAQGLRKDRYIETGNGVLYDTQNQKYVTPPEDVQASQGPDAQFGAVFQGPDGQLYSKIDRPGQGQSVFQNMNTGKTVGKLPRGTVRVKDTMIGARNSAVGRESGKDEVQAASRVVDATETINQMDFLERKYRDAGVGPVIFDFADRFLGKRLGVPGFADATSMDEIEQAIADRRIEIRQRMKGQGEITEQEGKLLYKTLPQMTTDPEAFQTVINIQRRSAKRLKAYWDQWQGLSESQKREYDYNFDNFKAQVPNPVPVYEPKDSSSSRGSVGNGAKASQERSVDDLIRQYAE